MKALILNVNRTKEVFDYPITENVYQNLHDIMDGVVVCEDDAARLMGAFVQMTVIEGVAAVAFDHVGEQDAEWVFSVYTGSEGRDGRELVEITAKAYAEDVTGGGLIADILQGLAACNLFPYWKRRLFKFLNTLTYNERIWAEILDAYFDGCSSHLDGDAPVMLKDYKTSAEIADDIEEMATVDVDFVTHYMYANGYRPERKPTGNMAWKMFRPIGY